MAPEVGFEPTTNWLTANCSTAELLRNIVTLDYKGHIHLCINLVNSVAEGGL